MERGSSSEYQDKGDTKKGPTLGSVLPTLDPFVPRKGHDPRELRSWAKRTGFVSNFSGETGSSVSQRDQNQKSGGDELDLEKGHERNGSSSPKIEIDPVLGRTKNRGTEIDPALGAGNGLAAKERDGVLGFRDGTVRTENQRGRIGNEPTLGVRDDERRIGLTSSGIGNGEISGNGHGVQTTSPIPVTTPTVMEPKKDDGNVKDDGNEERERSIDAYPDGEEPGDAAWSRSLRLKCGPTENPGFVPLIYYGLQHYLSLAGSLIFIPLIMVPAMGGTDKDTATVISTMLLVSGITTVLHSYFGTRLPLVQGSSFVYLAPALVIMNSRELRNLTEHKFRHIMRELQGAIIVGSLFQSILGFSGLMSLLLRLINPIVVAPTITAVGLAFFSYGFPQAGSCVEISLPLILLVLIFTLYLRGISVFGHRVFQIQAVPMSVVIIWVYAFFLTAGGAYNYKGCSSDIPSSNILTDACRQHAYTMKHCRTDVSNALRTAAWVRIPYPLQWGIPIFRLRTSIMMIIVSLVASVDSVSHI
ncbi:unnamed protein product [Ilex paraguariensis]|uniref:Nucleobase-ascorbate transporter 11 n=1 Tax=Ilex paraguariensis TaxID=185542 RepID=A0ABC8TIC4_9AQUA